MPNGPLEIASLERSASGRAVRAASTALTQIPFVDFTTTLVREVMRTIIDSNIEQLEAYSDLVASVSGTLATYQSRYLGGDVDSFYTATPDGDLIANLDDYLEEVFGLDVPDGYTDATTTNIDVNDTLAEGQMTDHFEGLSIEIATNDTTFDTHLGTLTPNADNEYSIALDVLQKFVYERLVRDSQVSYDKLVAILKLGMQRTVIDEFLVESKLTFHVDSQDFDSSSTSSTEDDVDSKAVGWGVRGGFRGSSTLSKGALKGTRRLASGIIDRTMGGFISGGYKSNKVDMNTKVTVINEKSTAATNVSIDIVGHVRIKGKTDYFPAYNPDTDQ